MSDLGIRMYCSKAELAQRPNDLMIELCTPAAAAVVAAPIQNEWPLNCDGLMPALVRVECSIFRNFGFARGEAVFSHKQQAWVGTPELQVR